MADLFNTANELAKLSLLGFVLVVLVFVLAAWWFEWFVSGRTHRREIERGDRLEATNAKLADSLDVVTDILKTSKRSGH